ncbi:hypothetical protein NFI96_017602 [Prochilodus magdalenae]|nr:hypothetical protein NFI96_017602 [Prochilodus magdalenae]
MGNVESQNGDHAFYSDQAHLSRKHTSRSLRISNKQSRRSRHASSSKADHRSSETSTRSSSTPSIPQSLAENCLEPFDGTDALGEFGDPIWVDRVAMNLRPMSFHDHPGVDPVTTPGSEDGGDTVVGDGEDDEGLYTGEETYLQTVSDAPGDGGNSFKKKRSKSADMWREDSLEFSLSDLSQENLTSTEEIIQAAQEEEGDFHRGRDGHSGERANSLDELCTQKSNTLRGSRNRYKYGRDGERTAGGEMADEMLSPGEEDHGGYGAYTLPCRRSHCLSEGPPSLQGVLCSSMQGRRAQTSHDITAGEGSEYGDSGIDGVAAEVEPQSRRCKAMSASFSVYSAASSSMFAGSDSGSSSGGGGAERPGRDQGVYENFRQELELNSRQTRESLEEAGSAVSDERSSGTMSSAYQSDALLNLAQGTVRKAGALAVKNFLVHKKNKKVEPATRRKWKRYWVSLKGCTLFFYETDGRSGIDHNSIPKHAVWAENSIVQAVPEHPKKDFVFCLSNSLGDAFLFQTSGQTELENWITAIHSACATAVARQHHREDTVRFLRCEIKKLEQKIDMDEKMKKMGDMQLSAVTDAKKRKTILEQVRDSLLPDLMLTMCYMVHTQEYLNILTQFLTPAQHYQRHFSAGPSSVPAGRCSRGRCPKGRCSGGHCTHRILLARWFWLMDDSQSSSDNEVSSSTAVSDPLTPAPHTNTPPRSVDVSHDKLTGQDIACLSGCSNFRLLQMALHEDAGTIKTNGVRVTGSIDGEEVLRCRECLVLCVIFLWEQNLEQFHMDLFRFRCYLSSLQGGELPNPKRLLAFASRPTKLAMGRLGIFSVSSFHALVAARMESGVRRRTHALSRSSSKRKSRFSSLWGLDTTSKKKSKGRPSINQPPKDEQGLPSHGCSLLQVFVDGEEPAKKSLERMFEDPASESLDDQRGSMKSLPQHNADSEVWLPDYLTPSWLTLPNDQPVLAIIQPGETTVEALEAVCKAHSLDPSQHYLRLKFLIDNQVQSYVPNPEEELWDLLYKEIQICTKTTKVLQFDRTESCTIGYGFSVAVVDDDGTQQLHITHVKAGGLAFTKGLRAGDEILQLNGKGASVLELSDMRAAFSLPSLTLTVSTLPPCEAAQHCALLPRRSDTPHHLCTDIFSQNQEDILDEASVLVLESPDREGVEEIVRLATESPGNGMGDEPDGGTGHKSCLRPGYITPLAHVAMLSVSPVVQFSPGQVQIHKKRPTEVTASVTSVRLGMPVLWKNRSSKRSSESIHDMLQLSTEHVTAFCRSLHDMNPTETLPSSSSSSSSSSSCVPSPISPLPALAPAPATQRQLSDADKLRKVISELVDTERTYVKDLNCLIERYLTPLQKENFLSQDELDVLFGNLPEMVEFQLEFLKTLEDGTRLVPDLDRLERVDQFKKVLFSLGGSFLYYADRFKIYSAFCASHTKVPKVLTKAKTDPEFKAFLAERNPRQQHSSTLESYLIKPIQRVLKYPLLLRELYCLTDPDSEEHYHLNVAIKAMNKVASHINEMQKIHEEYGAVFDQLISEQSADKKEVADLSMGDLLLHATVAWINPPASLMKGKKDPELAAFVFRTAVVFVYKDCSKQKKKIGTSHRASVADERDPFRFRHMISTDALQVRTSTNSEGTAMCEIVHVRSESEGRPERTFHLCCSSPESKKDFLKTVHSVLRDKQRRQLMKTESLPLNQQYIPFGGKRLSALKGVRPTMNRAVSAPPRTLGRRKLIRNRFTIDTDVIFDNGCSQDPAASADSPPGRQPSPPQSTTRDTDRWVEEQFDLRLFDKQTDVKETDILSDDDEYCESVKGSSAEPSLEESFEALIAEGEEEAEEVEEEEAKTEEDAGQNGSSEDKLALKPPEKSHAPLRLTPLRKQCAVEGAAAEREREVIWVRRDDYNSGCNSDIF